MSDTAGAQFSPQEWETRTELAAAYRLVDNLGWTDLLASHLSAVVPGDEDHFLINRYGLAFDEITASNLVRVALDGSTIDPKNRIIGTGAFAIHSAVHAAHPHLKAAFHLHTRETVAIASQKGGLLPLTQMALSVFPFVRYHEFTGFSDVEEREEIVQSLGDGRVLIMRNHGVLVAGETVGEAFGFAWRIQRACVMQLAAQIGTHSAELNTLSDEVRDRAISQVAKIVSKDGWNRIGKHDWAALVRRIDRAAPEYRT
ncbi:class II aldolase/adducin family protein [Lampropedia puyangensis]|uniref:Class II aldolase/adducin family protein n=1 Tax=Lampropedia puyangensis TaxID=1330072 RepID=A0A4S8ET76_9BURK|nr:class II aldolase/adducin family protein [Lampropedia puyangensis]THT98099.1 class II aldolase/adducin family protein [Lampropedia puyangensis]